jgi:hypothetical protein
MSHRRWLLILVIAAVGGGVWWARRRPAHYPTGYIADRSATLWSATAQVRRPVGILGYGEKVSILARAGDLTEVRSADGTLGWVDNRLLMPPALWDRVSQLLSDAHSMPVQGKAHTRTISNVHIEPGRDSPRIFQFGRNVPVAVLGRQMAASGGEESHASDEPVAAAEEKSDQEDWALVLYSPAKEGKSPPSAGAQPEAGPAMPIAGWILWRFMELDPPQPIGDYVGAAAKRVVAWAELNTVPDPRGDKPQYVVAAAKGGEGQPCDFTSIRVYTWGSARMQYETSFADNNVCGRLPLRVSQAPDGPEFRFNDQKNIEHAYRLMQTVVRRIAPPVAGRKVK